MPIEQLNGGKTMKLLTHDQRRQLLANGQANAKRLENPESDGCQATRLQIPTQAGRVFRDEAGRGCGMKPATVPI